MAIVPTSSITLDDAGLRVLDMIDEQANVKFTQSKIENLLNQCARQIFTNQNDEDIEAYRSTTIGVDEYELASPVTQRGIASVSFASFDGTELTAAAPKEGVQSNGTPTKYSVVAGSILLEPPPSTEGTLLVRYKRDYMPLSSGDAQFPITDAQVDVCVLYAAYMLKIADDEYTAAGMLRTAYEEALANATALRTGVHSAVEEYNYE